MVPLVPTSFSWSQHIGCELEDIYGHLEEKVAFEADVLDVQLAAGTNGRWSEGMWRELKREVEKVSGIPFRWKDMRPTFAQICMDKGMGIELVSKMLRHTSVATTEKYYARIRSEVAFEEFERMWEQPIVSVQKVVD
jgi:integrase